MTSPKRNITLFFIYHENHADTCNTLHKQFKNGTGKYYPGIYKFTNLELHIDMSLAIKYKDANNPLPEIIEKLNNNNKTPI